MKYYVLKTKDNKEFSIKEDLELTLGKEIVVIMPFIKNNVKIENGSILFFNRLLPNYLIIGTNDLSKDLIKKICRINNTDGFINSSTLSGEAPSELEKDEVSEYLKTEYKNSEIYKALDGDLVVLNGPYSGKTCRIKYKKLDYYGVIVNTRKTPEIKLPIWCLGKPSNGSQE